VEGEHHVEISSNDESAAWHLLIGLLKTGSASRIGWIAAKSPIALPKLVNQMFGKSSMQFEHPPVKVKLASAPWRSSGTASGLEDSWVGNPDGIQTIHTLSILRQERIGYSIWNGNR
jgi:hypothetical protein